jgi:hypothetical protein
MVTLLANELQVGDFVAFEGNGEIAEMLEVTFVDRESEESIFLTFNSGFDTVFTRIHPFDDVRVGVRGNR